MKDVGSLLMVISELQLTIWGSAQAWLRLLIVCVLVCLAVLTKDSDPGLKPIRPGETCLDFVRLGVKLEGVLVLVH